MSKCAQDFGTPCIFVCSCIFVYSVYVFLCIVLLAMRMVADVTETRNVIPNLEFKT